MNRADLIDEVRTVTELSRTEAEAAVEAALQAVMTAIRAGDRVSLFGFGAFLPTTRAARLGRNPRTGEAVKISASSSVRFAPSAAFKASLNPKKAAKKSAKAAPVKKAAAAKKSAPAKKSAVAKKAAPVNKSATKAATSTKKR